VPAVVRGPWPDYTRASAREPWAGCTRFEAGVVPRDNVRLRSSSDHSDVDLVTLLGLRAYSVRRETRRRTAALSLRTWPPNKRCDLMKTQPWPDPNAVVGGRRKRSGGRRRVTRMRSPLGSRHSCPCGIASLPRLSERIFSRQRASRDAVDRDHHARHKWLYDGIGGLRDRIACDRRRWAAKPDDGYLWIAILLSCAMYWAMLALLFGMRGAGRSRCGIAVLMPRLGSTRG